MNTVLAVIDLQGKLAVSVKNHEQVLERLCVLLPAARKLDIPIIWVEHVPEKLGATHPEVAKHLEGLTPLAKDTFNACYNKDFIEQLSYHEAEQVLMVGVESHVCILQTAEGILERGLKLQIVTDAVSSRNGADRQVALDRLTQAGAKMTTTEILLFELLKTPKHPQFREVLSLLK